MWARPGVPTLLANGIPRWTLPLAIVGASIATSGIFRHFDRRAERAPALLLVADNPGEVFDHGPQTGSFFRSIPEIPPVPAGSGGPEQTAVLAGQQPLFSRVELTLLQRARAAVAADQWADAQSVVTEHARRFPAGQLVEEREALRVKALMGLGKTREASRAARAFEVRFPHSVLGPAVARAGDASL